MKRALGIKFLVGIILFSLTTVAGASGKWDSLNLLKNVDTNKLEGAFIVRLEFEKPVDDYKDPIFFDKSVQLDFPGAFIKPAKKYYPADSFSTSKIFAAQFNADTLRIRFLKKDKSDDLQNRFHVAKQGRFVIVRLDQSEPVTNTKQVNIISNRKASPNELMDDIELGAFLERASKKIKAQGREKVEEANNFETVKPSVQTTSNEKVIKDTDVKVTRAGMGVEPIVTQIKKVAQENFAPDKQEDSKKQNKFFSDKKDQSFSLKDSRPTGKPIELVPSGLKMISMLAVVLGIMFLLFFGFKKFVLKNTMFGGGEKLVTVLGSGFLGPKKNIVLVEVAGEVLVLGMSQENITLLTNITDPEKIEEIKTQGGKGGSGLSWNQGNSQPSESSDSARKTVGQFSNYMKQFSGSEKNNKNSSVADVTAQIKQQMGRFKKARA